MLLQVAHFTGVFVKYKVQCVGAQQIATPFSPLLIEENNINNFNNDNISDIMSYY